MSNFLKFYQARGILFSLPQVLSGPPRSNFACAFNGDSMKIPGIPLASRG